MPLDGAIAQVAVAAVIGAALSWWFTARHLGRKFDLKLRRVAEMHRKHHETMIDKLNASHALARKELEHQLHSKPRQLSIVASDQRATVVRLEQQLKSAYAELDRLRLEVKGPAPDRREDLANGFAETQPFLPQRTAAQR